MARVMPLAPRPNIVPDVASIPRNTLLLRWEADDPCCGIVSKKVLHPNATHFSFGSCNNSIGASCNWLHANRINSNSVHFEIVDGIDAKRLPDSINFCHLAQFPIVSGSSAIQLSVKMIQRSFVLGMKQLE